MRHYRHLSRFMRNRAADVKKEKGWFKTRFSTRSLFTLFFGLCLFSTLPVAPLWAVSDPSLKSPPDGEKPIRQGEMRKDDLKLGAAYWKGYFSDTGKIITSPLSWDGKDWVAAALVVSATAGLYAYDQDLKEWFQAKRNDTTNDISKILNPLGNPLYTVPALGFVYLYGEHQGSEKTKRIGLLGIESMVLAGAFTAAVKFGTQRHRPDTGDRYNQWNGPRFSTDNLSFPSLHASTAFSLARVVAAENDSPYISSLAYGIASVVALTRLNENEHWGSDVFFGAAIGYFTAGAVLRYHTKDSAFALVPDVGRDRCGALLSYRF